MEGAGDPYCRGFYTERAHEESVYGVYRALGALRAAHPCFREGRCRILRAGEEVLMIEREGEGERVRAVVSRTEEPLDLPAEGTVLFCSNADGEGLGPFGVRFEGFPARE